ncbi:hypothetical protein JCGZ_24278 [Jatropha curcas]|uniref:Uncharacterized protein n=1 Tax=Jatropha curcas TaxID=180498 RepID=A0A067JY11_JATCU|nr:uncharacterized protein LOC105646319 [Jatropha curcas]KDP24900.1 hypothetical protein JCGZ_24278 [Jatropha curcas]
MSATYCDKHLLHTRSFYLSPPKILRQQQNLRVVEKKKWNGQNRRLVHFTCGAIRAVDIPPWDETPYEILPNGKKAYLDEEDVVTFLDPPKELIPLDPHSYNPATYLWKKIEDVPEDRRHRLLSLLKPRLISRAWQIAGTRYEDPNLAKKCASNVLCCRGGETSIEFYNCRSSGGPWPIAWMKSFKKAIFHCNGGKTYGRLIGGSILAQFTNTSSPLYFMVTQHGEVMATEQPCDLAYELGDGHLDLHNYPRGFPTPAKHPYPFNDQVVIYVRHVGPGVSIGQAWQEGRKLQQVPRKLCSEILMVKEYVASVV